MSTTTTVTQSSLDTASPRHDVATKLVFWRTNIEENVDIDMMAAGAKERVKELEKLDESHNVVIRDIRGSESDFTLKENGFQYAKHHVEGLKGLSSEEEIKALLLPATEELVKKVTGASKITTFTSRIRCKASDEGIGSDNIAPAHSVHTDCTDAGAVKLLEATIKDEAERQKILSRRFMIINVWRPLKTITKDPLAVCDWRTVASKEELIRNRLIYPHGWHEMGKWRYSKRTHWYHLGGQRPDEPLLFTQYDSTVEGGLNLPHTAFVDPEFVDREPRESLELKMFCFFED